MRKWLIALLLSLAIGFAFGQVSLLATREDTSAPVVEGDILFLTTLWFCFCSMAIFVIAFCTRVYLSERRKRALSEKEANPER